jgi:hypothetical protein
MTVNRIKFADSEQILKRKPALDRLIDCLFEPDVRPLFVSDEANLFGLSGDSTEQIIRKIREHYGRILGIEELRMPVWKLLDLLETSDAQHLT